MSPEAPPRPASGSPRLLTLALCALGFLAGCEEKRGEPDSTWTSEARAFAGTQSDARAAVLNPARRCAECHSRQFREWSESAHADAAREVYARVLETIASPERASCDACHVPLSAASDRIAREGVGCDACHTATGHGEGAPALQLQPELATKFGPFADSKHHHFHRVAFSEFVTGAELCSACHSDRKPGPVPIFTSSAEWRAGPDSDKPCQSCHMPRSRAEAAKGEQVRQIAHHGFGNDKTKALADAVQMSLTLEQTEAGQVARLELLHAGGGHPLPTDLPERRLALRMEFLDADAKTLAREERRYGRALVDAEGKLAPFFRAVAERSDERLLPGQPRIERWPLPARTATVRATLDYERFDPALSAVYGEHAPLRVKQLEQGVK